MLGLPFFSVTNLMWSAECPCDFWIGPHWLTGFPQNPYYTDYSCCLSPYPHSLGISGSVTSWLLPGSLPPTCRRLKNVRGYRSLLMITLLAQTLAVIQQLRHKPWTPTTTPRSWAVYLSSSMQWHWQSSWHLVTCGHVMAGVWNVNDETHHIWMSTQQDTRDLVQPVTCFSAVMGRGWGDRLVTASGRMEFHVNVSTVNKEANTDV